MLQDVLFELFGLDVLRAVVDALASVCAIFDNPALDLLFELLFS